MNYLSMLQDWYKSNCDGFWEHGYGVKIETLDNPGWMVEINLEETELENKAFDSMEVQKEDEDDWIVCKKEGNFFKGFGGPDKLEEILKIFLEWTTKE